jgi:hypothetical protein
MLHEHSLFVKSVESIVELRAEVFRALAFFLSTTVNRFKPSNSAENYALARQWLATSNIISSRPRSTNVDALVGATAGTT